MMPQALSVMLVAAFATAAGTFMFRRFAIRAGIVANPNFRTLHQGPKPRAGGIVFASVFLVVAAIAWGNGADEPLVLVLLGGAAATLFGFLDDVANVGARTKLLVQAVLAAWIIFCFGGAPYDLPWTTSLLDAALAWLALVWLMNLYNFMDGVDGMAASGALFISAAAIVALYLRRPDAPLIAPLGLLGACTAGFLVFNWPPARIFMGDAGSLFLGYMFGAITVATMSAGDISVWTWLVIFGYFAGDTTTTTVLRILMTDNWYGEHRSHAYQNLARIRDSHGIVVRGVLLYQVLWLMPLVAWSVMMPAAAPIAAGLALGPVVVWTLAYGPRLSSS